MDVRDILATITANSGELLGQQLAGVDLSRLPQYDSNYNLPLLTNSTQPVRPPMSSMSPDSLLDSFASSTSVLADTGDVLRSPELGHNSPELSHGDGAHVGMSWEQTPTSSSFGGLASRNLDDIDINMDGCWTDLFFPGPAEGSLAESLLD
ncbi:hypothetical protein E2562_021131 [Oryza meyeriana var. granulata]|uniref:Uncharacterized protein n=1 Tax=Oryza meyeriana var. granulata TaxID=110450 RepID=A0A6G1BL60_9ORYZ|nr:hypothetical protein E2562_021131 [Oryza meyeriana var. granulata]